MKRLFPLMEAHAENGSNPDAQLGVYTGASIASASEDADSLMQSFLSGDAKFFSTIVVAPDASPEERRETSVRIYNAISDAKQLTDHINIPLCVTDYMAHPVVLTDSETGEITPAIRVLIVTDKGESYAAVSRGVQSSIERMRAIIGAAPWHPGVWMRAVQNKVRSSAVNKVTSLVLLTSAEVKELVKK